MSWSHRRVFVVLTAVAALGSAACLQTAFAQKQAVKGVVALPIVVNPQPSAGGSADAAAFDLPKDTQARRSIEAAHDYIEAKQWDKVVEALQRILDDPQDKFAPLLRRGPDGKEVEVPTSVRAEANRLLAGLPKEGLEAYKVYELGGPKADEYLKKAKDATTLEERLANLGLVVRNYLHTDAGAEAADLLATHYMDHGDFRTASRFYGLLLTRAGGADALPADVLFRAAYAFDQADDAADEDLIWQSARTRGIHDVRFGDDTKSVADLKEYLTGLDHVADAVGRQWAYFMGDASHTSKGDGGPAFMRPIFPPESTKVSSSPSRSDFRGKIDALFAQAAQHLTTVHQPVLSPQFPVTATTTLRLKSGPQKASLIVYRTHAGIAAIDLKTRKIVGAAPIRGSLDWMTDPQYTQRETALNQWTQQYIQQNQRPGILFENTTIGTLSTDGDFAYTVEDLVVPPPANFRINMGMPGNPNPWGWPQDVVDMVNHSRLLAFDLGGGCKIAWDVPEAGDTTSALADSYFLGPPLCVNGKLYVLTEKQQELRLICLENVKTTVGNVVKVRPTVDSVLPLGTARDSRLQMDVLRRVNAAHLSYGEGVLICPTNLGYVIAIDLLQNSLLWAYPYRDKTDEPPEEVNQGFPPGFRGRFPIGMVQQGFPAAAPPQQGWKVSAPIIQDGKVVFTAPDSKSLHCVNLKDGTLVWKQPRQEGDLYLGGVVNGKVIVVGQKVVRAYNLSNGDKPWEPVETGLPSGFGAASENIYYVPLKEAAGAKEQPEICGVDVDRGVVTKHSKARSVDGKPPDVPGNLVFFDGGTVSQTNDEVTAYPNLTVKLAEMTDKLKANPNDVDGLFDRGELSLEAGNLDGAVQDFRQVLQDGALPAERKVKAKDNLYQALTEYFQHDFDKAEQYQDDYAALCSRDLPPTATEAERVEGRRRRINYLYLLAKGKEGQRHLPEAFDKYLELNAEAQAKDGTQADELLSLVDERLVKAAPDVLAQGRIAAMVAGASVEERKPLEARIASRWKALQGQNDLAELRKFVTLFGSLFTVGQEARLQLAERLMDDAKDPDALIDAERQLGLLRVRTQDPQLAARAVDCLARLNTRKGLLEDAAYYYRLLRDRYPTVMVRDGKTGADLFNDIATDKRLWGELDEQPGISPSSRLKNHAETVAGNFPPQTQLFKFCQTGEPLPFFRRYDLGLDFGRNELKLLDRTEQASGDDAGPTPPVRSVALPDKSMFQSIVTAASNPQIFNPGLGVFPGATVNAQPAPSPRFAYMNLGHLVVLPVGNMVYGLDAVQMRVLWSKNLFNPVGGPAPVGEPAQQSVTVDPRDGSVQVVYQDEWMQRLGQIGPLEGGAVCLQMKDALTAVDPVSGRILWTRADVTSRSHIFGDDQYVFVVEVSSENKPTSTRVFRAYDGSTVHEARDFHEQYEARIRLVGRDILTADKDKDATTLRLFDPLTGKDLWKQAFAPKSYVLQAEDGDLAGVVEPDGLVRVVDLATRAEVLTPLSKIDPKYLEKDAALSVLGDAENIYIAPNNPVAASTHVNTNLWPGTGLRGLNVNGELYAFRRAADEKHPKGWVAWHVSTPNEQLLLDQFAQMPMVVLTAQTMKFQAPFGGPMSQATSLQVFVKRTGIRLSDTEGYFNGQFYALDVDTRGGKIEFMHPTHKFIIRLDNERPAAPPVAP